MSAPLRPARPCAGAAGHRGVDLAGASGQVVRATLPGVVTYAGRIAGRGVVVVSHGAVRTTYEPVTASVAVGDEVVRAQVGGHVGALRQPLLPPACLHWGAIEDEEYLDPLTLVGEVPRPVRLLPLGEDPSALPVRPAGGPAGRPVAAGLR